MYTSNQNIADVCSKVGSVMAALKGRLELCIRAAKIVHEVRTQIDFSNNSKLHISMKLVIDSKMQRT